MEHQQLRDYISSQSQSGVPFAQIKESLVTIGWEASLIDRLLAEHSVGQPMVAPVPKSSIPKPLIIFLAALGVLLAVGGVYAAVSPDGFGFLNRNEPVPIIDDAMAPDPVIEQAPIEDEMEEPALEDLDTLVDEVEDKIGKNIVACTPTQLEFTHPFDEQTHVKEILGMMNGLCAYTESMPNGGRLDCQFNAAQQEAIQEYSEKAASATSIKISSKVSLSPSGSTTDNTEIHDGESVENPWNMFYTDGTCEISGYEGLDS